MKVVYHKMNQLVIAGSTLVTASLFQPLRRHTQQIIDRRFYRSKYNAARTLAKFGATLYNEMDLNQLSEQLVEVVQETMQPTHAWLWLRQPERKEKADGGKQPWTSSFDKPASETGLEPGILASSETAFQMSPKTSRR